jgi:hypothetical protein
MNSKYGLSVAIPLVVIAACSNRGYVVACTPQNSARCADAGITSGDSAPEPAAKAGFLLHTWGPHAPIGGAAGNWRYFNFFGERATEASASQMGDVIYISGKYAPDESNATLATAEWSNDKTKHWDGIAFGGGFYIEAVVSFEGEPQRPRGWPSLWAMSIEHLSDSFEGAGSYQWAGQESGFDRFGEIDFMEALNQNANTYAVTLHDHYGVSNGNSRDIQSGIPYAVRLNGTFAKPQKIGFLWIPATATTNGTAASYYNGQIQGSMTWIKRHGEPPPPVMRLSAFNVFDEQHFAIIVGCSNPDTPMKLYSLDVWQASSNRNLAH